MHAACCVLWPVVQVPLSAEDAWLQLRLAERGLNHRPSLLQVSLAPAAVAAAAIPAASAAPLAAAPGAPAILFVSELAGAKFLSDSCKSQQVNDSAAAAVAVAAAVILAAVYSVSAASI